MAAHGPAGTNPIQHISSALICANSEDRHTGFSASRMPSPQRTNQIQARRIKVCLLIFHGSGRSWSTHPIVICNLRGVCSENPYILDLLPVQRSLRHLLYRHPSGCLRKKKALRIFLHKLSTTMLLSRGRIMDQTLWFRLSSSICQMRNSPSLRRISSRRDRNSFAVGTIGIVLGIFEMLKLSAVYLCSKT